MMGRTLIKSLAVVVLAGLLVAGQAAAKDTKLPSGRLVFVVTADCDATIQSVPGGDSNLKDHVHATLTETSGYDLFRYGATNPYFVMENRKWGSTVTVDGEGEFVDKDIVTVKWKYTPKQLTHAMCGLFNDVNYFHSGPNEWKWVATIANFVHEGYSIVETGRDVSPDPQIAALAKDYPSPGGAATLVAQLLQFATADSAPPAEPKPDDPGEKLIYRFLLHKNPLAGGSYGEARQSTVDWPAGGGSTGSAKITVNYSVQIVAPGTKPKPKPQSELQPMAYPARLMALLWHAWTPVAGL